MNGHDSKRVAKNIFQIEFQFRWFNLIMFEIDRMNSVMVKGYDQCEDGEGSIP